MNEITKGTRVIYVPQAGDARPSKTGTVTGISGASAFVHWTGETGATGVPLERLEVHDDKKQAPSK